MLARLQLLPMLGLAVIWVVLTGEVTVSSVFYGLLVAALLLWFFPMPPLMSTVRVHPLGLAALVGRFLTDLVVASVAVAWKALRPRPVNAGSLLDVKLRLDDDLRRVVVAELTSLVPGTVVVDVDPHTSILTLHVLDVTEPEQLARERAKVHALEDRVERALSVAGRPARRPVTELRLRPDEEVRP
ncbi:Na+/H+ antiporter subunit E [Luteococcus peritonei]|uniref:Na+/H+ antiporter subunit E n=1 Tax=Luteococcus peritonei TaxID=88874 RepID=A0ABW4RZS8_9ACTN